LIEDRIVEREIEGKAILPDPIPQHDGGSHAELYTILDQERALQQQLADLAMRKTLLVELLCAEATISDITRKTARFTIKDKPGTIVLKRIDRLDITGETRRALLDQVKAEYDDSIKPFKDIHAAKKKLIETKALAAGQARKVASYYATFEGEDKANLAGKEEENK
jgi:hypothetical protein